MFKLISQGYYGYSAGDVVAVFKTFKEAEIAASRLLLRKNHPTVIVCH